jgi:flavin-dependent thymidylate synthase
VSYGQGTKTVRDDRGLIRYLMRHRHTTPFEMVEYKFLVRLPIFVARQWIRHRSASVNEYSARYSVVPDEYEVPPAEEVRHQSERNRQGRGDALPPEVVERFRGDLERISTEAYVTYTRALEAGVARETARLVLPVAYYTQWYWKTNLHNLFHFLSLRLDPPRAGGDPALREGRRPARPGRRAGRLRGVRRVPARGSHARPPRTRRLPRPPGRQDPRGRVRGGRPPARPRGRPADENGRGRRVLGEARTPAVRRLSRGRYRRSEPGVVPGLEREPRARHDRRRPGRKPLGKHGLERLPFRFRTLADGEQVGHSLRHPARPHHSKSVEPRHHVQSGCPGDRPTSGRRSGVEVQTPAQARTSSASAQPGNRDSNVSAMWVRNCSSPPPSSCRGRPRPARCRRPRGSAPGPQGGRRRPGRCRGPTGRRPGLPKRAEGRPPGSGTAPAERVVHGREDLLRPGAGGDHRPGGPHHPAGALEAPGIALPGKSDERGPEVQVDAPVPCALGVDLGDRTRGHDRVLRAQDGTLEVVQSGRRNGSYEFIRPDRPHVDVPAVEALDPFPRGPSPRRGGR